MDQLPQEIIDCIANHLERRPDQNQIPVWEREKLPSNLPPYATLSHAWKHSIERRTFQKQFLKSSDLDDFDTIFTGDRRRKLTELIFEVVLPTYDDQACGKFEHPEDKKKNDKVFSHAVRKFFSILKSWEDASVPGTLRLWISNIYSPADPFQRGEEKMTKDQEDVMLYGRHDLFEVRYQHSLIHLFRPDSLPTLTRVNHLTILNFSTISRNLDMRAIVDIASKFPNLKNFTCDIFDNENRYAELRAVNRQRFAAALSASNFPRTTNASISFKRLCSENHSLKPANLQGKSDFDPVSKALFDTFSQNHNLTGLYLQGVFDSSLFTPLRPCPTATPR